MPQNDNDSNLKSASTSSTNELTLDEKIDKLVKLYTEYEIEATKLHEEFLRKISEVRKKDDLKKLEELTRK